MKSIATDKSLRRYQITGFVSVIVMLGVMGGWSACTRISGAIIAPATLVAESYSKKIQHKEGGIVHQILVKDGDLVREGQDLVILDDTDVKAELGIIDALLLENTANRARLEAQRDATETISFPLELLDRKSDANVAKVILGQQRLFESRRAAVAGKKQQINEQIGQFGEQIEGVDAQRASKEQQLALIKDELVGLRELLKKELVQKSRVLALEREAARLSGERGELVAQRATEETKIAELRLQILQIDEEERATILAELRDMETKIAQLQERQFAARSRLTRSAIKAPIGGDVYQLNVHTIGGVIAPGETVMLILPEADDLVLQAQVAPQDIDQVRIGQTARVRFTAFNMRRTPEIAAEVLHVSADTARVDANSPPFYAVRLRIPPQELAKLGDDKLKPGMPAEAFIQTDARTPLSFLIKPLTDQIAHVFREG
jgi:HlyD family secretion protein